MAEETPKQATVLLVEDNLHNRRIFSSILTHYGFDVLEAADGEQAVKICQDAHPDIVLMDLSLPVKDGWAATRELKADQTTREIPVIALTAHAMSGDEKRALDAGCDGYLAKPISPKRVVEEVQRRLARRR